MFNVTILILILVGLVIHRYITFFWEQKILPYPMGFLTFATVFLAIYLVNFIWIFGFIVGIIIFLLTVFQITYASFLWPFLLPQVTSSRNKLTISKINPLIYGLWSYIVIGLGLFTIVNFYVSNYASLTENIINFFDEDYIAITLWVIGIMILSNITRIFILSKHLKEDKEIKEYIENEKLWKNDNE